MKFNRQSNRQRLAQREKVSLSITHEDKKKQKN